MSAAARFLLAGDARDPLVVVRSGFWRFNAIGVFAGGEACAIDPGITPAEIDALRKALETRARTGAARRVTHVVLTHSHHDHIRGWRGFPGARVVMPRIAAEKGAEARGRILAAKRAVDARLDVDEPGFEYPRAEVTFDDRLRLEVGGTALELRMLPGHSDCTSVVLLPELRTLCTADYLVSPGLPYCRWRAADFERALDTLARWVEEERVERVLPAHDRPILGRAAIHAAIDEERRAFAELRAALARRRDAGEPREEALRAAAREHAAARGRAQDPRSRQDLDNARRIAAEDWPAAPGEERGTELIALDPAQEAGRRARDPS